MPQGVLHGESARQRRAARKTAISTSIHPGAHWQPVLRIDQPAATLWFHPHPHGDTARQIYMGLTGMIIVLAAIG
jgi:FtsP/CotA-like multicopper oxidase with cupredoxin domain